MATRTIKRMPLLDHEGLPVWGPEKRPSYDPNSPPSTVHLVPLDTIYALYLLVSYIPREEMSWESLSFGLSAMSVLRADEEDATMDERDWVWLQSMVDKHAVKRYGYAAKGLREAMEMKDVQR